MDFYSLSSWLPFLLLVLQILILSVLFLKQKHKEVERPNHPPSPPKLPIIGHLHQLGKFPYRSLWQLSEKYGPVMLLHLGRVPTVVLSSAKTAREVLKTHDLDCCNRAPQVGPTRLSYNLLDAVFVPYGEHWKEMWKIFVLELFTPKRVQSFGYVREEQVALMIKSISQATSSPVNLTEKLFSLTDTIICRIAFGKSYQGREFDDGRFHEIMVEATVTLASFSGTNFFPPFGWIIDVLTGLHARIEKCFHDFDGFYQRIIDKPLYPEREKPEHEDIIDVMLGLERDEFGAKLTKDHVKAILMNVFLGGVSTSAVTVIWAMAKLIRNPRVMGKVQDEVRSYVGRKGKVDDSDVDQLHYLKVVVKETLRLHPRGPLLIPRESRRHFKVNGYDIYPKTRIVVNAWAIGRDPKYWENPEEFFPERFMNSSIDYKGQDFEFLPFGAGRRGCPGISMASATMELALANLLYCFEWELPSGMKELDMDESTGVAVHKKTYLHLVPTKYNIPLE